jgi:hypothetical protein
VHEFSLWIFLPKETPKIVDEPVRGGLSQNLWLFEVFNEMSMINSDKSDTPKI